MEGFVMLFPHKKRGELTHFISAQITLERSFQCWLFRRPLPNTQILLKQVEDKRGKYSCNTSLSGQIVGTRVHNPPLAPSVSRHLKAVVARRVILRDGLQHRLQERPQLVVVPRGQGLPCRALAHRVPHRVRRGGNEAEAEKLKG